MKIVIIGAGISGLITGLALKKYTTHEVKIFEKRSALSHIGGGIGVWPNGSELLLNFIEPSKMRAINADIPQITFQKTTGEKITSISADEFSKDYPILSFGRWDFIELLANEFGESNISFDKKLLDVQQSEDHIEAFFEGGTSEKADIIIAADGVYSKLRHKIASNVQPASGQYVSLGGLFEADKKLDPVVQLGLNFYHVVFPIANNRYFTLNAFPLYSANVSEAKTRQQQIDLFKGISDKVDFVMSCLEQADQDSDLSQHYFCLQPHDLEPMSSWHDDRLVLVGEAAHAMGPLRGLGTGTVAETSLGLAYSIAKYDENYREAFQYYESQLLERANMMMQIEGMRKQEIVAHTEDMYSQQMQKMQEVPAAELFAPFIGALAAGKEFRAEIVQWLQSDQSYRMTG